jgi:hypothetical protein
MVAVGLAPPVAPADVVAAADAEVVAALVAEAVLGAAEALVLPDVAALADPEVDVPATDVAGAAPQAASNPAPVNPEANASSDRRLTNECSARGSIIAYSSL